MRPNRRTVLKSALAGGSALVATHVLPKQWVKPVVDSVLLPAHAQGSPVTPQPAQPLGTGPFTTGPGVPVASLIDPTEQLSAPRTADRSIGETISEFFVPTVQAQRSPTGGPETIDLQIDVASDGSMTVCGDSSFLGTFQGFGTINLGANPPALSGPITLNAVRRVITRTPLGNPIIRITTATFANGTWTLELDRNGNTTQLVLTEGGAGCAP